MYVSCPLLLNSVHFLNLAFCGLLHKSGIYQADFSSQSLRVSSPSKQPFLFFWTPPQLSQHWLLRGTPEFLPVFYTFLLNGPVTDFSFISNHAPPTLWVSPGLDWNSHSQEGGHLCFWISLQHRRHLSLYLPKVLAWPTCIAINSDSQWPWVSGQLIGKLSGVFVISIDWGWIAQFKGKNITFVWS